MVDNSAIADDEGAATSAAIASGTYAAVDKLKDGRSVKIRAIRPDDKPVLTEGMHHLSSDSIYLRFFRCKKELTDKELSFFTELDFTHHVGLLALVMDGDSERAAGVGRYIMSSDEAKSPEAELAFTVLEEYQGLGIATILLKHLIRIARAEEMVALTALVLTQNVAMLRVFRNSGLPMEQSLDIADVFEIRLNLKDG